MPSGETVVVAFELNGVKARIKSLDGAKNPTIRVNNGAPQTITHDEIVWSSYGDDLYFFRNCWVAWKLPSPVLEGQSVTISFPSGLIQEESLVSSSAQNDFPVTNASGGSVFPDSVLSGRTLKIGLHTEPAWYAQPLCVYSNIARGGDTIWTNYREQNNPITLLPDRNGYPTVANSANIFRLIQISAASTNVPRGYELGPYGRYVLMWDGEADVILTTASPRYGGVFAEGQNSIGDEVVELRNITGNVNNKRVYDFYPGRDVDPGSGETFLSPFIRAEKVASAEFKSLSNLRVYPPDVAPGGVVPGVVPKFRPKAMEMISGMKALRSMTWLGSNSNGWSQASDIPLQSQMAFGPMYRKPRVKVDRIEPMLDEGSPYTLWPDNPAVGLIGPLYKVVTETPHGFSHGCWTRFEQGNGAPVLEMQVTLDNDQQVNLNLASCMIYVLDATSFVVDYEATRPFDPVDPPDLYTFQDDVCGLVEDFFELVNSADEECIAWINFNAAASDEAVELIAEKAIKTLAPGHKVILELTNEAWNPGFYLQRKYLAMGGQILWPGEQKEIRIQRYLVVRSEQIRKIFSDAWRNAGRREDVNLVICCWTTIPAWGGSALDVARDYDIAGRHSSNPSFEGPCLNEPGDMLGLTFYTGASPNNTTIDPTTLENMTLERHADILDAYFMYPDQELWVAGFREYKSILAAHTHPNAQNIRLVGYEGAWAYNGLYDSGESNQDIINSMSSIYHPRSYRRALAWFDLIDGSFDIACFYVGWQGYVPERGSSGNFVPKLYGIYKGYSQSEGIGDGSDGETDNSAVLVDVNGVAKAPPLKNLSLPIRKAITVWNQLTREARGVGVGSIRNKIKPTRFR